jgi:hypothetical protein
MSPNNGTYRSANPQTIPFGEHVVVVASAVEIVKGAQGGEDCEQQYRRAAKPAGLRDLRPRPDRGSPLRKALAELGRVLQKPVERSGFQRKSTRIDDRSAWKGRAVTGAAVELQSIGGFDRCAAAQLHCSRDGCVGPFDGVRRAADDVDPGREADGDHGTGDTAQNMPSSSLAASDIIC